MYSKMQEQHLFFTTFVLTAHIPFAQYRFTAFQISLKAAKLHLLEKIPNDFIFANDLLDTRCKMNGLRRPGGLMNVSYKFNLRPASREAKFFFFNISQANWPAAECFIYPIRQYCYSIFILFLPKCLWKQAGNRAGSWKSFFLKERQKHTCIPIWKHFLAICLPVQRFNSVLISCLRS